MSTVTDKIIEKTKKLFVSTKQMPYFDIFVACSLIRSSRVEPKTLISYAEEDENHSCILMLDDDTYCIISVDTIGCREMFHGTGKEIRKYFENNNDIRNFLETNSLLQSRETLALFH